MIWADAFWRFWCEIATECTEDSEKWFKESGYGGDELWVLNDNSEYRISNIQYRISKFWERQEIDPQGTGLVVQVKE